MKNKLKIRLIFIAILVFLLLGTYLFTTSMHRNRPRNVSIEVSNNEQFSVQIFEGINPDEHGHPSDYTDKVLAEVTGSQTVKLKPGSYVLISKQSDKYELEEEDIVVIDKDQTIYIDPVFKKSALDSALQVESDAVQAAVIADYPGFADKGFSFGDIELYKTGEWAGVVVTSNQLRDFFHFILKQEGTVWRVVTEPEIILGSPKYPDIPKEILSSENRKQLLERNPQIRE